MFKKLTKAIVKLDSCKELVPVESIADNEHFRPLCLLKKKKKSTTMFHPAPYYQHTGFTLNDVLLPGEDGKSIECLLQVSSQFTLRKASTDQVDGGVSISFDPASADLQGGASWSKAISVKQQKKSISLQSLEELTKERKININHSFIQQLRQLQRRYIDLYVVTEILEASEETVYKESTKADGGFKATFYATLCAKGNRESNQDIVIPKGCTLAFRTIQLLITDEAWCMNYFPGGPVTNQGFKPQGPVPVRQGSRDIHIEFPVPVRQGSRDIHIEVPVPVSQGPKRQSYVADGPSQRKSEVVVREVESFCQIFRDLTSDLQLVFNTIKAVMRDKTLFQELSQKMEEMLELNDGYELKTESPELKDLFSTLQHSPRYFFLFAGGITYILDALYELMDYQLLLLLESMERKILSQQLKLVENLLKHDLDKGKSFHVDARLLSFPHEEEQMLTMELVELSGVQLQEDGSAVPRDKPFESVAALFAALYALNLLSGSQ